MVHISIRKYSIRWDTWWFWAFIQLLAPSPDRYNASVDSLSNPEIFVTQSPGAAYPAYVITFSWRTKAQKAQAVWLVAVSEIKGPRKNHMSWPSQRENNDKDETWWNCFFLRVPYFQTSPKWHGMSLSQLERIESVFFPPTVLKSGHWWCSSCHLATSLPAASSTSGHHLAALANATQPISGPWLALYSWAMPTSLEPRRLLGSNISGKQSNWWGTPGILTWFSPHFALFWPGLTEELKCLKNDRV